VKDLNNYNKDPRIKLIDKSNNFIRMVSQNDAGHLLDCGFCKLLFIKPTTIQFELDAKEWDDVKFMKDNSKKGSRIALKKHFMEIFVCNLQMEILCFIVIIVKLCGI